MTRIQRLFQIVQQLQNHRLITARQLASYLGVSPRTIYRDIQLLLDSGIPVRGETGSGYWLEQGFDFPPSRYNEWELKALVMGLRATMQCSDEKLVQTSIHILARIFDDIPQALKKQLNQPYTRLPTLLNNPGLVKKINLLNQCLKKRKEVWFDYVNNLGQALDGWVRPLEIIYQDNRWSLISYSPMKDQFTVFRIDRMTRVRAGEVFKPEPGKQLMDYYVKTIQSAT